MKLFVLTAAIIFFCELAHGEPNNFLPLPEDISKPAALSSIKLAALNRKWSIREESESSISIYLEHRGFASSLTFSVENGEILYTDNTKKHRISTNSSRLDPELEYAPSKTPDEWLENLRKDTRIFLHQSRSIQLASKDKSDCERHISSDELEARLIHLKKLYNDGLISEKEYGDKQRDLLRKY